MIPFILKYWKAVVVAALVGGATYVGYTYSDNAWKVKYAELELKAKDAEIALRKKEAEGERITIKEVIKYVDRIQYVKQKARTIIKEVPVYVNVEANNNCTINDGFVWLHNAAASGDPTILSRATGDLNASTSGVELSTVAETVSENYTKYHELSEQLKALQNWVTEQRTLINAQ